jgi:hypothetical protein
LREMPPNAGSDFFREARGRIIRAR